MPERVTRTPFVDHPRRIGEEIAAWASRDERILDWGCGRGDVVRWLRDHGYDAEGADIDLAAISGDDDLPLHPIWLDDGCRTDLADDAFDFVFSQTVFEHVADLRATVAEIRRLTAPGGRGFHVFPPRFCIVEPHLRMPLVHWLPKSCLRYFAIRAWLLAGIGPPHPPELAEESTVGQLARFAYEYSCGQTFYRSLNEIVHTFERYGLRVRNVACDRSRVLALPQALQPAAAWAITTFKMVRLQTVRA